MKFRILDLLVLIYLLCLSILLLVQRRSIEGRVNSQLAFQEVNFAGMLFEIGEQQVFANMKELEQYIPLPLERKLNVDNGRLSFRLAWDFSLASSNETPSMAEHDILKAFEPLSNLKTIGQSVAPNEGGWQVRVSFSQLRVPSLDYQVHCEGFYMPVYSPAVAHGLKAVTNSPDLDPLSERQP